ncbi:murein biosynthesis integral membrane protein MurJ [Thalassotalea sp. PP2-459]|uniref:murein biosynthesis integral membrane protein MurJ n=1 Tax=Thalassotalea sp. PP2-459 TaxID=1742724 RepID=UPI000944F1BB|nr:murein biosynthesis integral membrane protein MurJ [Thalassotalea sp. PP2-459]OKY25762.1 murein biosynthesis integral membrane protein MurJ [Thalassotalea sp. PP2-459]
MSRKLVKSGIIVSAMTLISRVLGLVRDVVIASIMGAGATADAFFFANKIPNFLRRLFAEGAFAQSFVPVLSEYHHKDIDNNTQKTRELIAKVSGTLGVIVTLVTLIGMIASPFIVMLFGPGFYVEHVQDPSSEKFDLASDLLKITFPYLWFVSFTALSGAILNAYGKFAVSSFTPVLLNVAIISMATLGRDYFTNPEYALAWGVFLGGFAQFIFQIPFLYKAGALTMPKWGWAHEGVTKIRKLMAPALFGVSVTQINLLLDTQIASLLETGAVSFLYYADRLLEFPLGLFGIGIATVILPSLARLHTKKSVQEFSDTLDWGIKIINLLGWPALVGLMVLAQPIIMILFMRGEFTQVEVYQVSFALYAYLSGLVSFMFIKILAPGYYARQDTKTPVKIGIKAMVANMAFNIMLAPFFGYVGLAIATTLSATLNAYWLYQGLKAQQVYQLSKQVKIFILRLILASLVMAYVVYLLSPSFDYWLTLSLAAKIIMLCKCIFSGIICYFACAYLFGIRFADFTVQQQVEKNHE